MFGTPSFDSPFTYLGVLLLTIGIYLILSGFGILKIEKYATPEGLKAWGTGLSLVLVGLAILFVLPAYLNQTNKGSEQEVNILRCQNNPNTGIVSAETPIVLVWGWATDTKEKRDEIIAISSFIVEVDGKAQDMTKTQKVLQSTNTILWKLAIGRLTSGTHEIKVIGILSRDFTESSGTYPAGRQNPEVCDLVVEGP